MNVSQFSDFFLFFLSPVLRPTLKFSKKGQSFDVCQALLAPFQCFLILLEIDQVKSWDGHVGIFRGGNSSVGRASDWKARRNTDVGLSPRYGRGVFCHSQLPVQTLLRCPHSPLVQSHASTSVRTLKILNTGLYRCLDTRKCYTHWHEWV